MRAGALPGALRRLWIAKHRRVWSKFLATFFRSKFRREAPGDVCAHVASFLSNLPR